jgi:predicted fused transcriptional regulator/phosphomethylpyrimidine kinase
LRRAAPTREEQRTFLATVPEVAAKLKEAHTKERKFEDVVKSVEQATVLVLVY